ncbi:nucleotide exchange factor GrpE [Chloroflexota bacterium]
MKKDERIAKEEVISEENIEILKQELTEARAEAESNLAGWQRTQADFVNYKRRTEQERDETVKWANSVLVLNLLPVLDDFARAFASSLPESDGDSWVDGIRLVERKLRATLEAQGLSPIKTVGEPFDPYLHEAIRQDQGKEEMIIEEVQKGYKFHDKVIRPSQVVVGSGEAEYKKEE